MQNASATPMSLTDRRLSQAERQVTQLWFPINEEVAERIQDGLDSGIYELDIGFLIAELKSDFGLFLYCVRESAKRLQSEGKSLPNALTPRLLIELAGYSRLKDILLNREKSASTHRFSDMNDLQGLRLKEAMISSGTAETLSPYSGIDPDLAFSAGLLRQMGLLLVVWNYPTVYRKVLLDLKENDDIDLRLTQALGFSPRALATRMARSWGLGGMSEIIEARGSEDVVVKLCEIGEALARANDPEHYPSARKDWEFARKEVEETLGYEGLKAIHTTVMQNSQVYRSVVPHLFSDFKTLDPESHLSKHHQAVVVKSNQYLQALSPHLRTQFNTLYDQIRAGSPPRDTIRTLLKDIVTACGFIGGAVYVLDLGVMNLVPRMAIGDTRLSELHPVAQPRGRVGIDPISTAYQCSTPIISNEAETPNRVSITAVIGEQQRVGVVWLEVPRHEYDANSGSTLTVVKAIRQALNDCLNVN